MKRLDDFFDFSRMSKPSGIIELQQRITFNLSYFSPNYIGIACVCFLYCIFTNIPFFLFIFGELGLFYFVQKSFGNSEELNLKFFSLHRNIWYTILLVINVPLFFIWSPLSAVFWLGVLSAFIIVFHAAIIDKPVEASYSNVV